MFPCLRGHAPVHCVCVCVRHLRPSVLARSTLSQKKSGLSQKKSGASAMQISSGPALTLTRRPIPRGLNCVAALPVSHKTPTKAPMAGAAVVIPGFPSWWGSLRRGLFGKQLLGSRAPPVGSSLLALATSLRIWPPGGCQAAAPWWPHATGAHACCGVHKGMQNLHLDQGGGQCVSYNPR